MDFDNFLRVAQAYFLKMLEMGIIVLGIHILLLFAKDETVTGFDVGIGLVIGSLLPLGMIYALKWLIRHEGNDNGL